MLLPDSHNKQCRRPPPRPCRYSQCTFLTAENEQRVNRNRRKGVGAGDGGPVLRLTQPMKIQRIISPTPVRDANDGSKTPNTQRPPNNRRRDSVDENPRRKDSEERGMTLLARESKQ